MLLNICIYNVKFFYDFLLQVRILPDHQDQQRRGRMEQQDFLQMREEAETTSLHTDRAAGHRSEDSIHPSPPC